MNEVQPAKSRPDLLKWALLAVALIGAAAVLYVIASASFKPKEAADLRDLRRGELVKLDVPTTPRAAPAQTFTDPDGKTVSIADYKGQVLVVNTWATWCGPCKVEMPTLARLQAAYQTQPVRVITISVDRDEKLDEAKAFMAQNAPLKLYRDPEYKWIRSLAPRAEGFPTTVIYDRKGMERARLSGDADWSGKEARELVERLLAEG